MDALTAFFLGQLSLAILIFAFIKFFIFGEPPETTAQSRSRSRRLSSSSSLLRHPSRALRHKRSAILRANGGAGPSSSSSLFLSDLLLSPSTILSKTYYNVAGHQPETLDWFNVLVAQTLAQLRTEALHDDVMLKSLSAALNGAAKPDFLGSIAVTEMSLGDEFPIFSNCRIIPVDEAGVEVKTVGEATRLLARLDVDLSDAITLGVETKLVLNYPLPTVAVLPVALAVSVVRFSGTLSISFIPATPSPETDGSETTSPSLTKSTNTPTKTNSHLGNQNTKQPSTSTTSSTPTSTSAPQTTLAFSFLPDYRLDLSVRSLVGSRSRLQDVPKIAQLVEARIHAWLDERCVEPRYQQVSLPSMWPRKKNTRGGDDDDDDDDDDDNNHEEDNDESTNNESETEPQQQQPQQQQQQQRRRHLVERDDDGEATETETKARHVPPARRGLGNYDSPSSSTTTPPSGSAAAPAPSPPPPRLTHEDSLEARMAAEGRILRAATAGDKHQHQHQHRSQVANSATASAGMSTSRAALPAEAGFGAGASGNNGGSSGAIATKRSRVGRNQSTEDLRMPGRFD